MKTLRIIPLLAFVWLALARPAAAAQSTPPAAPVGNAALTNALTVSTAPFKLYAVMGYNSATNVQYVQVFSTVTGATNGATPTFSFPVAATNYFSFDLSYYGADLDACKVCSSSNASTLTLTGPTVAIQAIKSH